MEPHSLVGERGRWFRQVGAWPAASKTNASWPAHQLGRAGRSGLLTEGKTGTRTVTLCLFPRVPTHAPSPPSRWAGRYGPSNVRAAGRVSHKRYSLPPPNPTREGSPEGRTSSLWGSFPHFFPRNGAPAGQATVPCRSNGVGEKPPTPPPPQNAASKLCLYEAVFSHCQTFSLQQDAAG